MIYDVTVACKTYRVELSRNQEGWRCRLDGADVPLDVASVQDGVLSLLLGGRSYEVKLETAAAQNSVVVGQQRFEVTVRDPRSFRTRSHGAGAAQGPKKITAPMPGKVVRILAPAGTQVEAGQGVLVIEAMKMQNELKSPKKGTIKKLTVSEGAAVEAGQTLAEIE